MKRATAKVFTLFVAHTGPSPTWKAKRRRRRRPASNSRDYDDEIPRSFLERAQVDSARIIHGQLLERTEHLALADTQRFNERIYVIG